MFRTLVVALLLVPLAAGTHGADPEAQFIFLAVSPFGASGEDVLVHGLMNDHSGASNHMTIDVNGHRVVDVQTNTFRPGIREPINDSCNELVARMQSDAAFLQLTIRFGPACPGHDGRDLGSGAAFSGPQPTGDPALQHFTARLSNADSPIPLFDPEPDSVAVDPRGTGLVFWSAPVWCGSLHLGDEAHAVSFELDSSVCAPPCVDEHKGLGLGHQREGHPGKGQGHVKHGAPCPEHPGQGRA